jgi:hypothetical protein
MKRPCLSKKRNGGPCQRSARDGHDTCTSCAKRAAKVARHGLAAIVAEDEACERADEELAQHEAAERALDAQSEAVLDANSDADLMDDAMLGAAIIDEVEAWRARMRPAGDDEAASSAAGSARLYHCDYATLARIAPRREDGTVCDVVIVDAPYSARVHEGHDEGAATMSKATRKANGVADTGRDRRAIPYAPWTPADVDRFVETWSPLVRHWFVSLTDDGLVNAWRSAFETDDMIDFAPVPAIESGATVRAHGDGPPSWTTHLCAARKKGPGFIGEWSHVSPYYLGPAERKPEVGGKPVWLMREIVRDYTRAGWLVCDPCAGQATTLVAASIEGRASIGCEPREDAWRKASARLGAVRDPDALRALRAASVKAPIEKRTGQLVLLETGS